MKTITIMVALLLPMVNIATAQEDVPLESSIRNRIQIGLKAGASYANVYNTKGESLDADGRIGFTGGGFLIIPVGSYFAVQPELIITQKGFNADGRLLGNAYSIKRTTTFLEVPILFTFTPIRYMTIVAGPQYAYLLRQRDVITSSAFSYEQEQEFKQDNIRKNIFGAVGGVDVNVNHFVVSGRVGFDIQNNNGNGTSSTPRYKNVWSQLTIGYKLY